MYGNLANNTQILELIERDLIRIEPFNPQLLKTAHYPLRAYSISVCDGDDGWKQVHQFTDRTPEYVFPPKQYAVVEVREIIVLESGIIAKFIPSSNLVDQSLALTAGRLEYPFGKANETLRFGLKNQADRHAKLTRDDYIAYVEFYDLRGLALREVELTRRDVRVFRQRINDARFERANSDGVFYSSDDEVDE